MGGSLNRSEWVASASIDIAKTLKYCRQYRYTIVLRVLFCEWRCECAYIGSANNSASRRRAGKRVAGQWAAGLARAPCSCPSVVWCRIGARYRRIASLMGNVLAEATSSPR